MDEPQRRTQRRTHLDASVLPVERAFLARAAAIQAQVSALSTAPVVDDLTDSIMAGALTVVAQEYRTMAEELHWWLPSTSSRPQ